METKSLLPHFFRDVGKKRAIHAIDMLQTSSVGRIREILLASRPVESDPEVFLTFVQAHLEALDSYSDHIYWALSHMKQPDLIYVGEVCKKWQGEADIQGKESLYRSILHFIQEELAFRQPKLRSKKIGTQTAAIQEQVEAVLEKKVHLRPKTPPKEKVVRIPKIQQAPKLRARKLQNASPEMMQSWYLSGPDYATGNGVTGKSVVQQLIIQGNFRIGWAKYVKSIPEDTWKELGYKFPLTIPGMPDVQGRLRHTNEAMLEFFKESDPQSVSQLMQVQKKNPSVETSTFDEVYLKNMKRWYHQGYMDPKTNQVITGKTILQQCIATKKYAKAFVTYMQTLDAPTIESMGFAMRTSLSTNCRLLGMDAKDMKLESLLKALGETDMETMLMPVSKQHRKIIVSPAEYLEKMKSWYHQGYLADTGETLTGREIIRACAQNNGGYLVNFRSYVNSISPSEQKQIGVRFHTSFTGIFNYLGKDPRGTLLEFLQMLGEVNPDSIISELKRPLRATKIQGNSPKEKPQKIIIPELAPILIQPKKELIGEAFGDDIPENFRYGLRQCFLKIKKCMGESLELQESDVGVMRKRNEFFIVFRTQEIYEKIKQNAFAVEQAVEEANESVFRMINNMNSKTAKGITYVAFSVLSTRNETEGSLIL